MQFVQFAITHLLVLLATQTSVETKEIAIQCSLLEEKYEDMIEEPSSDYDHDDTDEEFVPSPISTDGHDCSEPEPMETDNEHISLQFEPKYIVFWSLLMSLFSWIHCPNCGSLDISYGKLFEQGTQVTIYIKCNSCPMKTNQSTWTSQPRVGQFAAGNILLSAAILFSGSSPKKVLRTLQHMGLKSISTRTYHRHQSVVLHPAVNYVWDHHQTAIIAALKDHTRIVLGGDGKADSPGHSAKYGTYTLMDLTSNKVVDVQLVQVK